MKIAPRLWGLKQEEQKSNQKTGYVFIGMKFYPLLLLSSVSSESKGKFTFPSLKTKYLFLV